MRVITIELILADTKEVIDRGLYGHNFLIPRLYEKIAYKEGKWYIYDQKEEVE